MEKRIGKTYQASDISEAVSVVLASCVQSAEC